jgi:predicted CxxxxCH...CXXCH cytochrome family protein
VWHTTSHGSPGAAPITCQTCHYETVDPANTAPGRFYYLDTTGSYQLPGGDPWRISSGWAEQLDCTSCHTGAPGAPPQGAGRVLPLRHVNGVRDVVFDPRTTLPPVAGVPSAPNTPTKPYWVALAERGVPWPGTAVWNGTTISFDLSAASYDRATKRCSGVACHLAETPTWGRPYGWGNPEYDNCTLCHPL